jgi:hypothetical protein
LPVIVARLKQQQNAARGFADEIKQTSFGIACVFGARQGDYACAERPRLNYVVYVPLNDSIYHKLDTRNGLAFVDDCPLGNKPISRIEAARLTLEAQRNLAESHGMVQIFASVAQVLEVIGVLGSQL